MNWKIQLPIALFFCGIFLYSELDLRQNSSAAIESSRFEPWTMEFRETFVKGCSGEVTAEQSAHYEAICRCFARHLEAEHVLPTNFDQQYSSRARFNHDLSQRVNIYFQSDAGVRTKETCGQEMRALSSEPDQR